MDLRTILVPTDFAPHAARALENAVRLGQQFGSCSCIHLLLAYEKPIDHQGARRRLARELENVHAAGLGGGFYLIEGLADDVIIDTAVEIRADLIVMGPRGTNGLGHAPKGSAAERVARLAPCPVLIVKTPEADRAQEPVSRKDRPAA